MQSTSLAPLRRLRWAAAPLVLGVVLLACSRSAPRAPATATTPPSGPRIPHATHADQDLACTDCHAPEGWKAGPYEPVRPTYAKCSDCHEDDDKEATPDKSVKLRFFDAEGRAKWTSGIERLPAEIVFRHGPHAATDCRTCHGDLDKSRRSGALFTMDSCMACHAQKQASNDCAVCHREIRQDVAPESHRHLWLQRHGAITRSREEVAEQNCRLCHTAPNFCEDCHQIEEPRSHTHLFRTQTHGFLAAADRTTCAVCHTTDFCERCHEETAPRSHHGQWGQGIQTHCAVCHYPLARDQSCRVCHKSAPHDDAPEQPDWHTPGMNCRLCHLPVGPGPGGAPPIRHIDNGMNCEACHK